MTPSSVPDGLAGFLDEFSETHASYKACLEVFSFVLLPFASAAIVCVRRLHAIASIRRAVRRRRRNRRKEEEEEERSAPEDEDERMAEEEEEEEKQDE